MSCIIEIGGPHLSGDHPRTPPPRGYSWYNIVCPHAIIVSTESAGTLSGGTSLTNVHLIIRNPPLPPHPPEDVGPSLRN